MKRGFTLIELIMVVVIIGILAAFAVPQYLKAVERAKGGKARHALSLIAQAEKMYRADNDTYIIAASGGFDAATGLGSYVELADIDADDDWDYAVSDVSTSAFVATATRKAGPNLNETIILNQSGVWDTSGETGFTP